jgi:hypothetical protein
MITLSWIIERLLVKPTEGTLTDVVITADWRCNGSETIGTGDDAKTYSGTAYGSSSFGPPTGNFTPYLDLEPEQILGWVFASGVDQAAVEANVTAQIQNQINPPIVCLPNPWLPKPEELSSGDSSKTALKPLRLEQIVDPLNLPTSDVEPSVDGMSTKILG